MDCGSFNEKQRRGTLCYHDIVSVSDILYICKISKSAWTVSHFGNAPPTCTLLFRDNIQSCTIYCFSPHLCLLTLVRYQFFFSIFSFSHTQIFLPFHFEDQFPTTILDFSSVFLLMLCLDVGVKYERV